MDDNELDRLFGEDHEAEEHASEESAANGDAESSVDGLFVKKAYAESVEEESDAPDDDEGEDENQEPSDEEDKTDEVTDSEETVVKPEEEPDEGEKEDPEDSEAEEKEPEEPEETESVFVQKEAPKVKKKPVPKKEKTLTETVPLNKKSIAAICIAVALVVMVVLVLFLPAFRVRNAHIEGNVVLTDEEILREVGLEYDAHLMSGISGNIIDILRLDYGKTEERIKKENPYIEDIRITIQLPSTVYIQIKERSKVCYIRTPDGYAALDKDGIVLELCSFDSGDTVNPIICGLNVTSAELGKPVRIENMNDYKKAIIVLGAILAADYASVGGDYSMFENTSEVRILPSGYIFLTIYSPSGHLVQIKLNSLETISDDMAWLLYAFSGDGFDKITVDGALDMTGDDNIFHEY